MEQKSIFRASWADFRFTAICILAIAILGYYEHRFKLDFYWKVGLLAGAATLFVTFLDRSRTYAAIIDKTFFVNSGQKSFGKDKARIASIRYIARAQAFIWKSWKSLMIIYFLDESNNLSSTYIREVNYKDETIKSLIKNLKAINPSIELDRQYQQLVNGEIPSYPKFKNIPAERLVADIENEMNERFGKKIAAGA